MIPVRDYIRSNKLSTNDAALQEAKAKVNGSHSPLVSQLRFRRAGRQAATSKERGLYSRRCGTSSSCSWPWPGFPGLSLPRLAAQLSIHREGTVVVCILAAVIYIPSFSDIQTFAGSPQHFLPLWYIPKRCQTRKCRRCRQSLMLASCEMPIDDAPSLAD